MKKEYHCCATCIHFRIHKEKGKPIAYFCGRLGYQTKPTYRFDCWTPKEQVKRLQTKK